MRRTPAARTTTSARLSRIACHVATLLAALLLAPLAAAPLKAQVRWPDQRRCGPFHCYADFPLDDYDNLLSQLGQLQRDVVGTLQIDPPREPIRVYLFQKKRTYQAYIQQYFPQVPYRRALYVKTRGPGMVFAYQSREFEVDVRHECTHALLHATLPVVPLWLDEGLAEYFEIEPRQRAGENPHLSAVKWNVWLRDMASMEDLESLIDLRQMGRREYRHAWSWVHFLLHGPIEARGELLRYLADLESHNPPGHLSRRLRRRLPDVESRFVRHFQQWRR